jgi:hypothetical protein
MLACAVTMASGCVLGTDPDSITAVAVDPPAVFMIVDATAPVSVFAVRSDGARVSVPTRSAQFRSSDHRVARMAADTAGLVYATARGEADIEVTLSVGARRFQTTMHVSVGTVLPGQ